MANHVTNLLFIDVRLIVLSLALLTYISWTAAVSWEPLDPRITPAPNKTSICRKLPNSNVLSLKWDTAALDPNIMRAIEEGLTETDSKKFKYYREIWNASKVQSETYPFQPKNLRYYWESQCLYDTYYITKFYHKLMGRWCYIPFTKLQQVSFVLCKRRYCCVHPAEGPNGGRFNSICVLGLWIRKRFLTYCPPVRNNIPLLHNPWDHLRIFSLKLPQCCECMTCRDMRITVWEKLQKSPRFDPFDLPQ